MKVSNYASNSNNFKLRIFLKSQSKGESSSQYPILNSQKFVFGDDEKNHKTPKPLILYEDTSDRYKSTTNSSTSSHLRKLTKRITQSTDSETNVENPISFYQILDGYNDQYLNLHFNKDRQYSQEKPLKKIQRLYTEQTELKKIKQKPLKEQQTYSQNQNAKKLIIQNKNQQTSAKKITGKFNYSELIQQYIYQLFINLNLIQYFGLKEFIRISLRILFFQKFFLKKLKDLQRELNQESNLQESLGELKQEGHHEDFGDIFVHQVIETIEFVLGSISNTASYLRLWALSFDHGQLAEVFYQMCLNGGISNGGFVGAIRLLIGYSLFSLITFGVLMMMDVMECFLHALLLNLVEFQSKFFKADGYAFQKCSYFKIMEENAGPKD